MRYLYEDLGGSRYAPTGLCRTGWNDTDQHGGPPAGLLTRAIERVELPAPMRPVRVTVSLMRAVPLAPLTVSTEVVRAGRRVAIVAAHLTTDDDVRVASATAQCIRLDPAVITPDTPTHQQRRYLPGPPEAFPTPDATWGGRWGDDGTERFHLHAVTINSIDRGWERPGPGSAWVRLDTEIVAGEHPSPIARFAALADLVNGLSRTLSADEFSWVNPDMAFALHRVPEGEWIGFDARADVGPDGIGVASAVAHDSHGDIGSVTMTQLLQRL